MYIFDGEMDGEEELSIVSVKMEKEATLLVSSTVGSVIRSWLVKVRVTITMVNCVRIAVGPGTSTVFSRATVIVDVVNFVEVTVLNFLP